MFDAAGAGGGMPDPLRTPTVSFVVVKLDRTEQSVDAHPGTSLMEAIRNSGIDDLAAACGGCCSCATCHVYVTLDEAPSADEDAMLDCATSRRADSRLACQMVVSEALAGRRVTVAPDD